MPVAEDIALSIGKFLAAAWPDIVALWTSHGKDDAAALATLRTALKVARDKTDADLKAKHGR